MNSDFDFKPKNPKKEMWPILAAVFLVTTVALGVLYFLEIRLNKKLQGSETTSSSCPTLAETASATESEIKNDTAATTNTQATIDKLNTQIKTLTQEKTAAEAAKTTAETAKTAAEAAKATAENNLALEKSDEAIALKYNDLVAYFLDVVDTHNGLAGITNAEYNSAKTLAEKTGDETLIDKLDYVWDQVAVDQVERIRVLLDYIQAKISAKLQ